MTEYHVDPERRDMPETGIWIRAKDGERWGSFDLSQLDKASVLNWLKSRGGDNPWAENAVGFLLGHGNLHETPE